MHGDGWLCVSMEEQPCGLIWLVYFLLLPLDLSVVLCVGFLFYNMHACKSACVAPSPGSAEQTGRRSLNSIH